MSRNYENTKIYKLVSDHQDGIYIGSTTTTLTKRLCWHKELSRQRPERRVYKYITENGGWDNWRIVLVAEYSCKNVDEMKQREEEHRRVYHKQPILLNSCVAWTGLTREEYSKQYRAEHKEKIQDSKCSTQYKATKKIADKKYYEDNKERIQQYKKEWERNHKERLLEKSKSYREQHKDDIKERDRSYRERNREKIQMDKSTKIACPTCGMNVTKSHMKRHQRSSNCASSSSPEDARSPPSPHP